MREFVRNILGVKQKQMIGYHRYPLNLFRKYPDFIVIGAQKAASTSLHHYLALNNTVVAPPIKETQFFNMNYNRGLKYYKSIFPIRKKGMVTFESTPDYLSHPLAPGRCHNLLPNAKIIVTLRNPVDRAFSHFNFVKGYGGEENNTSFEEALELENKRIREALELIEVDPYESAGRLARFGYKRNGCYADHLENWLEYYSIENFYFVDFEDIKNDINSVMKHLCSFLNLPFEHINREFISNKTAQKSKLKKETYAMLDNFYKNHNAKLFDLMSKKYDW